MLSRLRTLLLVCMLEVPAICAADSSVSSLGSVSQAASSSSSQGSSESRASSSSSKAGSSASDGKTSCYEAGNLVEEAVKLGGMGDKEEAQYRKAAELCPSMAEAFYNLGVLLSKKGDYPAAVANIEAAIKAREDPAFHVALGNVYASMGKYDDAQREFNRVLQENSKSVPALQGMALANGKRGEDVKALEFLERAKAVDDSNSLTWFNLGVIYDRGGQLEAAVQSFEKAAVFSPKDASVQLYLGRALRRLGETSRSQRAFERAAELNPDEPAVQVALGAVYDSQGDPERAERALRRAVESDPKNSTAWVNLALVQLDAGRAEDAARSARSALERPGGTDASVAASSSDQTCRATAVLGWALLELGRTNEADEAISRCIELTENSLSSTVSAQAYWTLAALRERQGKADEAREHRATARKMNPQIETTSGSGWRVWR